MSSGLISRTSCKQRWVDKQIRLGLCIKCTRKAVDGFRKCEYHLRQSQNYRRKVYKVD